MGQWLTVAPGFHYTMGMNEHQNRIHLPGYLGNAIEILRLPFSSEVSNQSVIGKQYLAKIKGNSEHSFRSNTLKSSDDHGRARPVAHSGPLAGPLKKWLTVSRT